MDTVSKQKAWQTTKREVKKITDKLGMPVDKEIVETVTILRLPGFKTVFNKTRPVLYLQDVSVKYIGALKLNI